MAELVRADDRCDAELSLAGERLRVDREPGLALRREDVVGVQVLMQQHLLALRARKLSKRLQCRFEQLRREAPVLTGQVLGPPGSLLGERPERLAGRLPEPRQQLDEDVEGGLLPGRRERRPRHAALEQQRVLFGIVPEEPNRAVAVPELERRRLVLGLAVRLLHLQHCVLSRRRDQLRGDSSGERLAEGQAPARRDQASVGQRYASACRLRSDGSFSRISRSRARSSSAEITVSSSGACATTIPHGSTIRDRP